jgi:hypothetical protein
MSKEHLFHEGGSRLVLAAVLVAGLIAVAAAPRASSSSKPFIQTVQISNTIYSVYDIADVLSLIPQQQIRLVMSLVRHCGATGHYGYYSRAAGEVGAVAWFPRNPLDCLGGVSGGGPGGACYHAYWANDAAHSFVAFFGNTARMCARMATQVPGGSWVRTVRWYELPSGWIAPGTSVLLKCQRLTSNGLYSVGVFRGGALPGSRYPYWFPPAVLSSGNGRVGAPSC